MKNKIKEVRNKYKLSQQELADKLDISRQAVSKMENSDSVTLNTLEKIAAAIGCSIRDLIPTEEKNGLLTFESGEAFTAFHNSLIEDIQNANNEYMQRLSVPALKLNEIGRKVLLDNAESLAANEDMTK